MWGRLKALGQTQPSRREDVHISHRPIDFHSLIKSSELLGRVQPSHGLQARILRMHQRHIIITPFLTNDSPNRRELTLLLNLSTHLQIIKNIFMIFKAIVPLFHLIYLNSWISGSIKRHDLKASIS